MSTKPAARADAILRAIDMAQAAHRLFDGGPLVVAVSGGADSVCLLHALVMLSRDAAAGWWSALHVAHLDHALRPGSAEDAAFVAELAARWHLPCHHRRLPENFLRNEPGNLEANARRARYAFLGEVAREVENQKRKPESGQPPAASRQPTVATAHHADDQAETLLLHLLRGSGLQGLGGMRAVSLLPLGDAVDGAGGIRVRLVRPLLNASRAQILDYLHAHRLPWRDDPTNQDEALLRNRLRHRIMPLLAESNPSIAQTLARSAQILADEAERAQRADADAFVEALVEQSPGRRVLDVKTVLAFGTATQRGLLRLAAAALANEDVPFAQVETLRQALDRRQRSGTSRPHSLGRGLSWTLFTDEERPRLSLHRTEASPFTLAHPLLDVAWPTGGVRITPGQAVRAGDWVLHVERLACADLPPGWNATPAQREQGATWQAFLDADQVQQPLLATPQAGMRVAPLGMNGQHKTLGDFFTDAKVPLALRPRWPLVIGCRGEILWVGGFAPSHPARITPTTAQVLHLSWSQLVESMR